MHHILCSTRCGSTITLKTSCSRTRHFCLKEMSITIHLWVAKFEQKTCPLIYIIVFILFVLFYLFYLSKFKLFVSCVCRYVVQTTQNMNFANTFPTCDADVNRRHEWPIRLTWNTSSGDWEREKMWRVSMFQLSRNDKIVTIVESTSRFFWKFRFERMQTQLIQTLVIPILHI